MKKFGVIGHPVKHSLSPAIHHVFSKELGFEIEYTKIDPGQHGFLESVSEFRANGGMGLSVTLPFKSSAYQIAQKRMPAAEQAKVANTLWWSESGELYGDNTDGLGLVWDLQQRFSINLKGSSILVIGAGGAAAGILPSLLVEHPGSICIANRTLARAQTLMKQQKPVHHNRLSAIHLHDEISEPVDLIVYASSQGHDGIPPSISTSVIGPDTFCYDLTYGQAAEPFLKWASLHGATCYSDGLGMLVAQAAFQCERWLGKRPCTETTLNKLYEILDLE